MKSSQEILNRAFNESEEGLKVIAELVSTDNNVELVDSSGNALIGQKAMAASLPVAIASNQSAVPVSGTFYQATQPVSIAANVAVKSPTITWTSFGKTLGSANAEALMANQAADIVVVKAKSTNTGVMVIGPATVTADNGIECPAANAPTLTFTGVTNLNQIYCIGTSGDKCGGYYGVIS